MFGLGWLIKLFTQKKSTTVFWIHVHTNGEAELMQGSERFPAEPATKQILESIRSGAKYTAAALQKLAQRYHFVSAEDAEAFKALFPKPETAKKPEPAKPASATSDFDAWAAANPIKPLKTANTDDDFFEQFVAGAEADSLPKSMTGPGTAIGVRIEVANRTFKFINRKIAKGETLVYATDRDITAVTQSQRIEAAAQLIYHDSKHAKKMQDALVHAGYKPAK